MFEWHLISRKNPISHVYKWNLAHFLTIHHKKKHWIKTFVDCYLSKCFTVHITILHWQHASQMSYRFHGTLFKILAIEWKLWIWNLLKSFLFYANNLSMFAYNIFILFYKGITWLWHDVARWWNRGSESHWLL